MTIYFYTKLDEYGNFSNFSKHGIEMVGLWWPTVEHYFQAQKFVCTSYQEQIRKAHSSKQAAELGRSCKLPIRKDWELVKDEIMYLAVLKKFQTHDSLKEQLLSTGSQNIVENAPGDYYWGCGKTGAGMNKLGKILVRVREELTTLS
ncbi:NADAR family protein [Thalassotalea sp. PS06]|uniref:NADAR family protein n=1 Tax=Thalassotalea sp. PS06 TaxID=2594005 RepID=UPI00116259DA|nr:NADAR family protein [Thalassotalea sp. PS06]QDP00044.1 NADAR family protein [Thalassotalea sp. PS06]